MGTAAGIEEIDFAALGKRLKALRKKAGLTQGQVASELGVTSGYVSNVENNHTAMSIRFLAWYGQMAGMTLDELIDGKNSQYVPDKLDQEILEAYHRLSLPNRELMNRLLALMLENHKESGVGAAAEQMEEI